MNAKSMPVEDMELPAKALAVRFDVYRWDGTSWWLNASRPTLAIAMDLRDDLLRRDCNLAVRIVRRTGKVVA